MNLNQTNKFISVNNRYVRTYNDLTNNRNETNEIFNQQDTKKPKLVS